MPVDFTNERNHEEFYERIAMYRTSKTQHQSNTSSFLGQFGGNGQNGNVFGKKSKSNGTTNTQKSSGNSTRTRVVNPFDPMRMVNA